MSEAHPDRRRPKQDHVRCTRQRGKGRRGAKGTEPPERSLMRHDLGGTRSQPSPIPEQDSTLRPRPGRYPIAAVSDTPNRTRPCGRLFRKSDADLADDRDDLAHCAAQHRQPGQRDKTVG
jgi:hypothetical protein